MSRRENLRQVSMPSMEPNMGFELTTPRSQPELKPSHMLNQRSHSGAPHPILVLLETLNLSINAFFFFFLSLDDQ